MLLPISQQKVLIRSHRYREAYISKKGLKLNSQYRFAQSHSGKASQHCVEIVEAYLGKKRIEIEQAVLLRPVMRWYIRR